MAKVFQSMRGNKDINAAYEAIAQHRQSVEGDGVLCAEVLAGGEFHYRLVFWKAFKGFRCVSPDMAEPLWEYFKTVFERYWGAPDGVSHEQAAKSILDALEVTSPPTEKEIADAWEVESGSSEEGRRTLYGPDGHPKAVLDQLREVKH